MKPKTIIIILTPIIILMSSPAGAYELDQWSSNDTIREVLIEALLVADWSQTTKIANNPTKFSETNPILGPHPGQGQVDTYFISTLILHPFITWLFPPGWRDGWQWFSVGTEGNVVYMNMRVGL